jgi:hypothetical protein
MEKIKRGKDRVNIRKSKPDPADKEWFTGGYIFKKDRLNIGERGFGSSIGLPFAFEDPKERDLAPEQKGWLPTYVNAIETALFAPGFRDPAFGYRAYLDVDSFIDFHWMVEATKNIDGYWFSQFYHMDRGGKLKAGPLWDWDLSFGNAFYHDGHLTNGWRWEKIRGPHYKWYARLFEDPDFFQRYIDRWTELRTNILATERVWQRIDRLVAELREAQERNYRRWPTLGEYVHPNRFVGKTYDEEVDWLKAWIRDRFAWIDSQGYPAPRVKVMEMDQGGALKIQLTGQVGRIFYTLDGSDPRLSGGTISSAAQEYKSPVRVESKQRLFARALSEYDLWSAPTIVEGINGLDR